MRGIPRPRLVISADWSTSEKKRWMCRAERQGRGPYIVYPPEPVGDHRSLFGRLAGQVDSTDAVLIGFDFPIGLPAKYAAKAKVTDFRKALPQFGMGRWREFYTISDEPSLLRPFFPKPTQQNGNYKTQLTAGLGFKSLADLRRRCDVKTESRGAAECLFYTLGGQQVGAGAIIGWRDMIAPASQTVSIWPFDGTLAELLVRPGITLAEIYPGEAYAHVGIRIGRGSGRKKTSRIDRKAVSGALLRADKTGQIKISDAARSWIEWGFLYEDDFDAMVGLLSMLLVVTGQRCADVPGADEVRNIEGWILGQAVPTEEAA